MYNLYFKVWILKNKNNINVTLIRFRTTQNHSAVYVTDHFQMSCFFQLLHSQHVWSVILEKDCHLICWCLQIQYIQSLMFTFLCILIALWHQILFEWILGSNFWIELACKCKVTLVQIHITKANNFSNAFTLHIFVKVSIVLHYLLDNSL